MAWLMAVGLVRAANLNQLTLPVAWGHFVHTSIIHSEKLTFDFRVSTNLSQLVMFIMGTCCYFSGF